MVREWPVQSIMECISTEKYATQIGPFGSALKVEDYRPTGVPLLRGVNVNRGRFHDDDFVFIDPDVATALHKYKAGPGDVILVHRGTLGKIGLIPREPRFPSYIMGNSMLRIRCDAEKLLPEFLYYWLTSTEGQHFITSRAVQVGVPALPTPLRTLRELSLPIPSLEEQTQIVETLGALDDKIEVNRRMNATLEAMAQAVFKEWFVDGGRSRFSDGGKAEEGWEERTIAELADLNDWTLGKGDDLDVIDYIEISEVDRGNINTVQRYMRGEEPSRARRRLRHGDTALSTVRPDRGCYFLAMHPSASMVASTGFAVVTPKAAPWSFIHAALTQPEVSTYLGQHADGGAYPAIRPEIIGAYTVPWPTDEGMLDKFHEIVAPLYERAHHNREESRTLTALRDTLLPKLMRGEVRVKQTVVS